VCSIVKSSRPHERCNTAAAVDIVRGGKMRLRVIVTLAMALTLAVGSASAVSIGVFWDEGAGTCSHTQAPFAADSLYVIALLNGPAASGITGAEFRIDGWPANWFPTWVPHLGTALDNPISGGCNVAFPCDTGTGGLVILGKLRYFPTSAVTNRVLLVNMRTVPSNLTLQCSLMTLCDAPAYTGVCVGAGEAHINGTPCNVGVEPVTWTTVKGLYAR
jgi:hypothetical protein